MKEPETPEQWQVALDTVVALLAVDAAKRYGLGTVNMARCREILQRAKALGYQPSDQIVERIGASVRGAQSILK